ncbi:MAG: response regulator [Deltaproteobacteria bacterium]|nr:response regulator [Deltaproteobacteria bacterium]
MIGNHAYKIMVVEDEAVIALRLQQRLTEMGYDVPGIAYSGEEAVEKARSLIPDLILMDIMIPGKLDGIDAAEILRAELDVPVVFLTAFSEEKIIERAKKAEPYGYILKPFQDHEIKAVIEVALYKKKMEEKLRKAYNELEARVKERTMELNTTLKAVARSEKELVDHQSKLEEVNKELLETNRALSVLARNIDGEKELLENKIHDAIVTDIMPVIAELQNNKNCRQCTAELEVLQFHLSGLISRPSEYRDIIILLTEQEMRVATLIKKGLTNKKIASMLFISEHTVKTHRRNIRKKLKIQNANINLGSYLKSKFMDQENKI